MHHGTDFGTKENIVYGITRIAAQGPDGVLCNYLLQP